MDFPRRLIRMLLNGEGVRRTFSQQPSGQRGRRWLFECQLEGCSPPLPTPPLFTHSNPSGAQPFDRATRCLAFWEAPTLHFQFQLVSIPFVLTNERARSPSNTKELDSCHFSACLIVHPQEHARTSPLWRMRLRSAALNEASSEVVAYIK